MKPYSITEGPSQAAPGKTNILIVANNEKDCQTGIFDVEDRHPRVNWIGPMKTHQQEWTAYGRTF